MEHDFNNEIYSPAFQVNQGAHLIEASAGTGKTYNIQNLYARFIMETDCRVANILVMTFTEAATKELREKLHAVLEDLQWRFAGRPLEGKNKDDREKRAESLIACIVSEEARRKARERVELALLEFDGAAISTIHGFCQRVLVRYAFETGMDFSKEVKNSKNADLDARAEDWWRAHRNIVLKNLKNYVRKLGEKAYPEKNYTIDSDDDTLKAADEIVKQYEHMRLERENLSFDDLLRALWDALQDETHGKALADKLREEYKVALIDEFQDTDPVQYDIFRSIFMNEGSPCPLYFVGDPKQAIYAFRGGDIYTYLQAKNAMELQNRHIIKVNHRSITRLVDAVNAMFHEDVPGKTFGNEAIPFTPSITMEEKDKNKSKGVPLERPLQIVEFSPKGKSPAKGNDLPGIMNMMTGKILDILNQKNDEGKSIFSPSDIAILMNAKTDMPEMQKKLLSKGIPCVISNPGNVFDTSIALELKVFLSSVAEAGDSTSGGINRLRAALLTVFEGKRAEEVDALKDAEDLSVHIDHFRELKNIWCAHGFAALSNRMEREGYLQRLAERPNGERLLSDVGQIMELCCAATKEVGSTPEALVKWLAERISKSKNGEEGHDSDEYERELETDGDAVKIMTIHVSKGLQFPIVFLPDCWRICSPNDERNKFPLPYYHDETRQNQLVFAIDDAAKKKATGELSLEKTRLLYVALTRAVQQTILFTPSIEALGKLKEPLGSLLENLMANTGGNPPCQWEKAPEEINEPEGVYTPDAKEKAPKPLQKPRSYDLTPVRGSYSSLVPGHRKDEDASRDRDDVDSPFNEIEKENLHPVFRLPSGTRLGTCWHNILENVAFDADVAEIRRIAEAELLDSGFNPDAVVHDRLRQSKQEEKLTTLDITVKMLEDTLKCKLTAPDGKSFTLRDISWQDRLSEQEFSFSSSNAASKTAELKRILLNHWKGDVAKQDFIAAMELWKDDDIPHGYLTGFMDLVFRHDGFYYIIDWKSNSLNEDIGNFTTHGIRKEMAKHGYFFQYMFYAAVLHSYLKSRLGDRYSHERNFGGVRYYFLRGITAGGDEPIFVDTPSKELLDEFSRALGLGMEVK